MSIPQVLFPMWHERQKLQEQTIVRERGLYKTVSNWIELLPLDITALNMYEYFLLDINEMKRNDL